MVGIVKTIDGVKKIVPLDKTAVTDLDLTTQNNAILKFNRSENRVVDSGFKTDIIPSSASANNKLLAASDVVNEVASGNLHSVTSNAVAQSLNGKVNTAIYTDVDFNTVTDFGIYQVLLTGQVPIENLHCPIQAAGTLYVGRPSTGENITQIYVLDYGNKIYIRHINLRLGDFENWVLMPIERCTVSTPLTSSNMTIASEVNRAEVRNGMCYLYVRFMGSATLTDGMVIATLDSRLRPAQEFGFIVYNNATNKNYYCNIMPDGRVFLWWNENANVNYDFFISVIYVLY